MRWRTHTNLHATDALRICSFCGYARMLSQGKRGTSAFWSMAMPMRTKQNLKLFGWRWVLPGNVAIGRAVNQPGS